MHARRVEPDEERPVGARLAADEILGRAEELLVNRRHARDIQRAGILDLAVRRRLDDAAWPILFLEIRILRVEVALGLLLGVEVVEIAEELIKAVLGRQMLVAIAEMVLAELAGGVALRL